MNQNTILPNFLWWGRRNAQSTELGKDSPRYCNDIKHYNAFSETITYQHNSRGFRDQEWPDTVEQLQQCIWCIGDSQAVGLGNPISHTWPFLLEQALGKRCINVSMPGQSNDWMARKIQNLLTEVVPSTIIVSWSFTHRREQPSSVLPDLINLHWKKFYDEIKDTDWPVDVKFEEFHTLPSHIQKKIKELHRQFSNNRFNFDQEFDGMYDDARLLHYSKNATIEDDTQNTIDCINCVEQLAKQHNINIIHSFSSPNVAPKDQMPVIEKYLKQIGAKFVPVFAIIDWARDKEHYGVKTSEYFVNKLVQLL